MDEGLPCCKNMGSYNKSASYTMDRCDCPQNMFFADASFIYWNVSQEYMDFARPSMVTGEGATLSFTPVPNAHVATPNFKYKPGFKVGIGIDTAYDGWVVRAEYTWLHQKISTQVGSATPNETILPTAFPDGQLFTFTDWFPGRASVPVAISDATAALGMGSHWKMHLDMVDLTVGRPHWLSRNLSIFPSVGLRGLWIRQSYDLTAFGGAIVGSGGVLHLFAVTSNNNSHCWSVGPTASMAANWLIGAGLRIESDMGFSLLYTRYTKIQHQENNVVFIITPTADNIDGNMNNLGCVRPTADMGLGLGWGTYFCNKDYHIDLVARYDFNVFWDQNVMRNLVGNLGNNLVGYADPVGDLYLHGLTVTAKFDF